MKGEPFCVPGGDVKWCICFVKESAVFKNVNTGVTIGPQVPGTYSEHKKQLIPPREEETAYSGSKYE